jgi:hypothetical protein
MIPITADAPDGFTHLMRDDPPRRAAERRDNRYAITEERSRR